MRARDAFYDDLRRRVAGSGTELVIAEHDTPCGDGVMVWRRFSVARTASAAEPKPPLVLLHGGSGAWTHWIATIPAFVARFDIWAPDLPGLGDSAMPAAPHTPQSSGEAVALGLRQLLAGESARPHMVGFSFGAHVGAYTAAVLQNELASFTLSGAAALGLPHPNFSFLRERTGAPDAAIEAVHRANLEILMIADPARIDATAIAIQAHNVRLARFKSRIFAPTREILDLLPHLQMPLGAIWGDKDQIALATKTPPDGIYALLRGANPNIVCRTVPDAGHWAAYEQPTAFNAALSATLAELR